MKQVLIYTLVALLGWVTVSCDRGGDSGTDGVNGINGVDGIDANIILSGKGEPTNYLGVIGDFYLDLNNYNLYGPKSEQGWGNPINLIGAKGKDGADGRDGADGKDGVDGQNGKDGRDGRNGTDGADGRNGKDGRDGKAIPRIWAGEVAPINNIGNDGDFYLDTKNKVLYGPKTNSGWGIGFVLGRNTSGSSALKTDYLLSRDGTILLKWVNSYTTSIDMESDPDLRKVKIISKGVFRYMPLQKVVLPKSLKTIEEDAFYGCKLSTVEIPEQVEFIGNSAFAFNQIESLKISNSVKSIGDYAFQSNKITNLVIPSNVDSIGVYTFARNQIEDLKISNGVKSIGDYAFQSNKITNLVIPNTIESIGIYAFNSNQIMSLIIHNGVKSIGDYAFERNKITNVVIPNSITSISRAVFAHNLLEVVDIPSGVTSINDGAFYDNNLKTIIMRPTTPPKFTGSPFLSNNSELYFYVPKNSEVWYERFAKSHSRIVNSPIIKIRTIKE